MSKSIESYDKKPVWYFDLYWKVLSTNKKNDNNKMNLSPPSFHSFLNSRKSVKSTRTLKFSDFQFAFFNVLWKIKHDYIGGLFCIANLLEVDRKKNIFLILWILTPCKPK